MLAKECGMVTRDEKDFDLDDEPARGRTGHRRCAPPTPPRPLPPSVSPLATGGGLRGRVAERSTIRLILSEDEAAEMPLSLDRQGRGTLRSHGRRRGHQRRRIDERGPAPTAPATEGTELIKERYPNGSIRIEREITQDAQGQLRQPRFVEDVGRARQSDSPGSVRVRQSHRRLDSLVSQRAGSQHPGEAAVLAVRRTVHLASHVQERLAGRPWTIYDGKTHKISQWSFDEGKRHGTSIWWFANGKKMREATLRQRRHGRPLSGMGSGRRAPRQGDVSRRPQAGHQDQLLQGRQPRSRKACISSPRTSSTRPTIGGIASS